MRVGLSILSTLILILGLGLAACAGAGGGSAPPAKDAAKPAAPQPAAPAPAAPQQPAQGAAKPAAGAKKLDFAYILPPTLPSGEAFKWMAEEVTKRSNGSLQMVFHGGTLSTKELEIMDGVKSGNIALGSPSGAASSVFPELGVLLVPYLVRDYEHAYKMFNGEIGKQLDDQIQKKNNLKVLFFYDYGFRHFWNTKRPITKPDDMRGLKLRVQQGKVFADTINGLGASAVPMPWGEVIPAVQQGVVDGADLPVVNIHALKAYEVAKYASLTYHNYGPTLVVMNLDIWKSLTPEQQKLITDVGMEAQKRVRQATESVDSLEGAKKLLEPVGMQVNAADIEAFRKVAQEKIWPRYQEQYKDLWQKIVDTK
jgi:tripartite ATP-independent transporter DctP family solute receptor